MREAALWAMRPRCDGNHVHPDCPNGSPSRPYPLAKFLGQAGIPLPVPITSAMRFEPGTEQEEVRLGRRSAGDMRRADELVIDHVDIQQLRM
jgi:hypothetical protein